MLNDNHFKILGVTRTATQEEIKKSYREQVKLWHPDKFFTDKEVRIATEKTQKINEAYSFLRNYNPPNNNNTKPKTEPFNKPEQKEQSGSRQNIIRTRVKSSNVFAIGYDAETKILQVEFKNHSVYEYYDVPLNVYEAFMKAESKGRFMGYIYGYKYRRV